MKESWAVALDRWVIRAACRTVQPVFPSRQRTQAALELIEQPDFFPSTFPPAPALEFSSRSKFQFNSLYRSEYSENNIVPGKLFRAGRGWQSKPVVLLVHGWNGEPMYRFLFPVLGRMLALRGINAVMIEMPFHASRKPRAPGAVRNFLSDDLLVMLQAVQQSLLDLLAVASWCKSQTQGPFVMWGFSMGAWLAGLLANHYDGLHNLILSIPVSRLDRAIERLDFCQVPREAVSKSGIRLDKLNLTSGKPKLEPARILIHQADYDVFAPADSLQELWEQWNKPQRWRLPQGHISLLFCMGMMWRSVSWLKRQF